MSQTSIQASGILMIPLLLLVAAGGNPLDNFMTVIDTQFFASRRLRKLSKSLTVMDEEKRENKIIATKKSFEIKDYTSLDNEVVKHFYDLSKSSDIVKSLDDILKIGVQAAKMVGTTEKIDYIEKEFKNFLSEFEKLNNLTAGEQVKQINNILDINNEKSPLRIIADTLLNKIEELKLEAIRNQGKEEAEDNSTMKGGKFEDQFETMVEKLAKEHGDEIENTKNKTGKLLGNKKFAKKGDFVQLIKELKKILVWEVKNYDTKLSMDDIHENLDKGLENRNGDIIVLVSKKKKGLPSQIGWFKEIKENQLVIALGNDDDDVLHEELVHIAYMWARMKLLASSPLKSSIDPAKIRDKITCITQKLDDLDSIKTQCKNLHKSSDEIERISTQVDNEIKKELMEIHNSLN